MTAEHLKGLLESEDDSLLLAELANSPAQADVPSDIVRALRLGRITALQKPDNGVRGIVVGKFIRRLVARTLAKQFSEQTKKATDPYQYALETRAGCECVAHVIQALTDLDDNATVVSVDGVGTFDLISRNSMLSGLMGMREGEQFCPLQSCSTETLPRISGKMRLVTSTTSTRERVESKETLSCQCSSASGNTERCGQLRSDCCLERSCSHTWTICMWCANLTESGDVHTIIGQELWRHAKISVHRGKMWNRGGTCPDACAALTEAARMVDPRAVVWRGVHQLAET